MPRKKKDDNRPQRSKGQRHHKEYERKSPSGKTEHIKALGPQSRKELRKQVIEAEANRKDLEDTAGFNKLEVEGEGIPHGPGKGHKETRLTLDTPAQRARDAGGWGQDSTAGGGSGRKPPKDPNWQFSSGGSGSGGGGPRQPGDWDWENPDSRRGKEVVRRLASDAAQIYQQNPQWKLRMGATEAQNLALTRALDLMPLKYKQDIEYGDPQERASLASAVRKEAFEPRPQTQSAKDYSDTEDLKRKSRSQAREKRMGVQQDVKGKMKKRQQIRDLKPEEQAQLGVGLPAEGKDDIQKAAALKRAGKEHLSLDYTPPKAKISNKQFLQKVSPEERRWINEQMDTKGGVFFGARGNQVPGRYRKWQQYVSAREQGYDPPTKSSSMEKEWKSWIDRDLRGRTRVAKPSTTLGSEYRPQAEQALRERKTKGVVKPQGTRAADRYKSSAPSHEDFGVGIRVPGVETLAQVKERLGDDATQKQVFEAREQQKKTVFDEMMENDRSAHETRQEELLGRKPSDTSAGKNDRVVFFTTSTGWPAVSVGANSLVGQYIIRKRKAFVVKEKLATRAETKGMYPTVVRDQHLVEVATGLSVGAQGRYGAFKQVGWRHGNTKSKGYGRVLPVGAQMVKDQDSQPMYDSNGNVRYTEGYTRPFDISTDKNVGLRIYIG